MKLKRLKEKIDESENVESNETIIELNRIDERMQRRS
jgi:hypothetical protein